MFMIERDDVDALGEFENRLRIVVVANPNVIDHQRPRCHPSAAASTRMLMPKAIAACCAIRYKLTSADDPNRWEVID